MFSISLKTYFNFNKKKHLLLKRINLRVLLFIIVLIFIINVAFKMNPLTHIVIDVEPEIRIPKIFCMIMTHKNSFETKVFYH
jgi:hypothetical protein